MSKKVLFPLIAVVVMGAAAGCHAEARIGNAEPKAATPPPPPAPPPPAAKPEAAPAPKAVRAFRRATVENNEIKIPGKIHFDTDKAVIKEDKDSKEILETVAEVLKENPHVTKLRVEGHTDDQGAADHNKTLSQQRADAVVDWLVKNGVDKNRLDGKGWGQDRPLVKNDSPANREQNRRVEFKLWELEGKATEAQKNDAAPTVAGSTPAATTPAATDPTKKAATPTATATPAATKK